MANSTENELHQKLKSLAPDNRIHCAVALKLAKDLKISPGKVGQALNELKIRIVHCQLGCFQ